MKNERKPSKKSADTTRHEGSVNDTANTIDNVLSSDVESESNQPIKKDTMSFDSHEDHSTYTTTVNPITYVEPTKQELKAAAAQAKINAKAEKAEAKAAAAQAKLDVQSAKKEAAEAEKAERAAARLAAIQSKNQTTKEERAAAKAERAERLAALDPNGTKKYFGPMLALADRVKQGIYVKGATGQLRSTNELAEILDAVPVDNVIRLAKIVLGLDENPYTHLNVGQQSMNLRNRMRGAITKGTLDITTVRECVAENGFATATDWAERAEAKRATRAANAAAAKEAKEAKAAAKAATV